MRIAIDARAANRQRLAGVEFYTLKLIEKLIKIDDNNEYTLFFPTPVTQPLIPKPSQKVHHQVIGPKMPLWRNARLPLEFIVHPHSYDLFFSPSFNIPRFAPPVSVTTFHDLAYEVLPQYFSPFQRFRQRLLSRSSARRATRLIAVSQATKSDLIDLYQIDARKIEVIHNSYNRDIFYPRVDEKEIQLVCNKYQIQRNYLLFTGTLQGRKGVDVLIKTFDDLKTTTKIPHLLVLVGGKGWRDEVIYEAYRAMKHKGDVIFTGYVPNEDLPFLYSGADVFVLPSLYEGFGIPILEAMACGTPVITSNVSSLPEVGGDAAYYVDPANVDQLSDAIKTVLTNENIRVSMRKRGLKNVARFSWEKAASRTLAVFEKAFSQ